MQPHLVEFFTGRKGDVAEDGVVLRHPGWSEARACPRTADGLDEKDAGQEAEG